MKKILITGGAGFIGSAIVPELQKFGHEIVVIDDLSFGSRAFINVPDHNFFQCSILDEVTVNEIIREQKPEIIIHLAAVHFIPFCNEHPFLASNINIKGTMNVLNAASKLANLEKILFASTAAVYPISDFAVSENHELNPLDIYGLTKLTGESLCSEFHMKTQIPTIICRFFNAFGPNETNPHLIPEIQKQIINGNRSIKLGNTQPKRDFIHTSDMAIAIRMLLEQFNSGIDIFNLGRGIEYSVVEIVEAFERQIGHKIEILTDPERVRKTDRMHLLADISKLKELTGWAPTVSIDEGIKTLIA